MRWTWASLPEKSDYVTEPTHNGVIAPVVCFCNSLLMQGSAAWFKKKWQDLRLSAVAVPTYERGYRGKEV